MSYNTLYRVEMNITKYRGWIHYASGSTSRGWTPVGHNYITRYQNMLIKAMMNQRTKYTLYKIHQL